MKQHTPAALAAAAVLATAATASHAAVLAADDFSAYSAPTTLDDKGDASGGFDEPWTVNGTANEYQVLNTADLGFGNYVSGTSNNTFNRAVRGFDTSPSQPAGGTNDFAPYISMPNAFDSNVNIDQGVLYLGVVIRGTATDGGSSYVGVDDNRFSNVLGTNKVYVGRAGGSDLNYSLVTRGTGGSSDTVTNTGVAIDGSVEFAVFKLDMDADVVSLWLGDSFSESDTPEAVANLSGDLVFKSARAYRGLDFDEYTLATTFAEAYAGSTAVPEPASLAAVGLLGGLALRRRRA